MTFSLTDFKGQHGFVRLPVALVAAGNFTEMTTTAWNSLRAAIVGVTMAVVYAGKLETDTASNHSPGERPANPNARRETKGLFRVYDTTTKQRSTFEVPTVDPSKMHQNGDGLYYAPDNPHNHADWDVVAPMLTSSPFQSPFGHDMVVLDVVDVGRRI